MDDDIIKAMANDTLLRRFLEQLSLGKFTEAREALTMRRKKRIIESGLQKSFRVSRGAS